MPVYHETFKIQSDRRPTFHDVTEQVREALGKSGIQKGILLVFSQHTTCSVMIQEASDDTNYWGTELLMQDLVNVLENIIPTCRTEGQYLHPGPKHIQAAAGRDELPFLVAQHGRPSAIGSSGAVAIHPRSRRQRWTVGEFGHIYFADFDQVRARETDRQGSDRRRIAAPAAHPKPCSHSGAFPESLRAGLLHRHGCGKRNVSRPARLKSPG